MSEENVDIVRRGFDAYSRGDGEAWLAGFSDHVKLYPRPEEPGVRDCYEGIAGLQEYLANWFSGWEQYTVEPEQYVDAGEYVIVDMREIGVAKQSGLRVEETFAHAFKISEGEVVEWRMFGPVDEALQAIGLSE